MAHIQHYFRRQILNYSHLNAHTVVYQINIKPRCIFPLYFVFNCLALQLTFNSQKIGIFQQQKKKRTRKKN